MSGPFRLPLIPIFVLYTLGIYAGHYEIPFFPQAWIVLIVLIGLWALLLILKKAHVGSWIAFSIFFLLGIFSIQLYLHPENSPENISRFIGLERIACEGIVVQPPEYSRGRTQLRIRPQKVILSNRQAPAEGLLLLFLREEEHSLRVGDRLRFSCRLHSPHGFRNPGGFSYERHLALERIHTIGFLSEKNGWVKLGEGFKNPVTLRIERWRDHIRNFLDREAGAPASFIFKALVLGEQGDIPEETKESFILTGTAHLLAISGDQFGIVALLSFSFLIWVLKRSEFLLLSISVKKWAAGLTIPCILLYAFIAGGGISVIRAAIMVITFLVSILLDRERNLLHTLALAAFLILLFSPPSLFDVSFQLSFLAVLSILYLVPRIVQDLRHPEVSLPPKASWKKNMVKYILLSLLVTAVAIVGTAPFVALHFNRFAPLGFITNLFIVPWVGFLIVPLSLSASIFSFFFTPLAAFLIRMDSFITLMLLRVLASLASVPFASVFLSTPTPLEILLFYLLLFLSVSVKKKRLARYLFFGVCFVCVLDVAFWSLKDNFQTDLRLTFIDVGHGDSILIEFPKGKRMLVDGGGLYDNRFDTGKNIIAPFLWSNKIRRIDTLVLTHPDPDHLTGLNFIASRFSIGEFWDNGIQAQSALDVELKKTLAGKKIATRSVNEETPSRTISGVEVSFLNPPGWKTVRKRTPAVGDGNNASLVMRLRFGNVSVLLPGDIGKEAEDRMLRREGPLRSDILKIPHHGSGTSSTPLFLERVKPTYAILSVGERNLGKLPHPEVLKRYRESGTTLYRTDVHGAITVVTDGQQIQVRTFSNAGNLHKEP